MKKKDQKLISVIRHDLLHELHKHEAILIKSIRERVDKLEFQAARYKEKEVYDDLLEMKRALNILKCYFEVTHTDDC
jgi:hypothetical protein